tara:strand:+ start:1283 stop:1609 length:327 start_codon:yes stop_codon:yes gene_type:complete
MKTCTRCKDYLEIKEFIHKGHINKKCNNCNKSTLKNRQKDILNTSNRSVFDLIIHSINDINTLYAIRENGVEVTILYDGLSIIESSHNLNHLDKQFIENELLNLTEEL